MDKKNISPIGGAKSTVSADEVFEERKAVRDDLLRAGWSKKEASKAANNHARLLNSIELKY